MSGELIRAAPAPRKKYGTVAGTIAGTNHQILPASRDTPFLPGRPRETSSEESPYLGVIGLRDLLGSRTAIDCVENRLWIGVPKEWSVRTDTVDLPFYISPVEGIDGAYPMMRVCLNGHHALMLIDTGADRSLLFTPPEEKFPGGQATTWEERSGEIRGSFGSKPGGKFEVGSLHTFVLAGRVDLGPKMIERHPMEIFPTTVRCHIPDLDEPLPLVGLIGRNDLRRINAVIDLGNLVIKSAPVAKLDYSLISRRDRAAHALKSLAHRGNEEAQERLTTWTTRPGGLDECLRWVTLAEQKKTVITRSLDPQRLIPMLDRLAKGGDAEAQALLKNAYLTGKLDLTQERLQEFCLRGGVEFEQLFLPLEQPATTP